VTNIDHLINYCGTRAYQDSGYTLYYNICIRTEMIVYMSVLITTRYFCAYKILIKIGSYVRMSFRGNYKTYKKYIIFFFYHISSVNIPRRLRDTSLKFTRNGTMYCFLDLG